MFKRDAFKIVWFYLKAAWETQKLGLLLTILSFIVGVILIYDAGSTNFDAAITMFLGLMMFKFTRGHVKDISNNFAFNKSLDAKFKTLNLKS